MTELSAKAKVEKAHALVSQTMQRDLRVVNVNGPAVRAVLSDVRLLLEESLGMTAPRVPPDVLRPTNATPEVKFDLEEEEEPRPPVKFAGKGKGKSTQTKIGD